MLNVVVALLVAQAACGEENANLRGRTEPVRNNQGVKESAGAALDPLNRPKSNEEYVSKIFEDLRKKLNGEGARVAAAKSELNYYGGKGPQLSYGGYFVSRERKYTNNYDCSGPGKNKKHENYDACTGSLIFFVAIVHLLVETLVARNLACERTGEDRSTASACFELGNGQIELHMYEYSNQNCTGNLINDAFYVDKKCSWNYGVQCIPPEDHKVPAFTEKDSLTT